MPVEDLLSQFEEEDRAGMKKQLSDSALVAHNVIPDKHAQNIKKAKKQGIHPAMATPATKQIDENDLNALMSDFHKLQTTSPKTAKFYTNQDYAKIAHDDHPILSALEGAIKPFKAAGARVAQGFEATTAASLEAMDIGAEALSQITGTKKGGAFKAGAESARGGEAYWKSVAEKAGSKGIAAEVYTGIGSAPIGVSEFVAGPGYAGLRGAAEGYKKEGVKGLVKGALIESVKLYGIRKVFSGIEKTALSPVQKSMAMAGTMGVQTAAEGGSLHDVVSATLTGLVLMPPGAKGRSETIRADLVKKGIDPKIAETIKGHVDGVIAHENAKKIKDVVETAKTSKLKGRDPEAFKEFVKEAGEDSKPVSIPVEKFDELIVDLKLEDVLEDPSHYFESKFEGRDVDIPLSDLTGIAERITPEHINDMKFEGEPSVNEIKTREEEKLDSEQGKAETQKTEVTAESKPRPEVKVKEEYSYQGNRQGALMGPNDVHLVAKDAKGQDVGRIWYTKEADGISIRKIEVDAKSQRQGIATELMRQATEKDGPRIGSTDQTPEGKAFIESIQKTSPELFKREEIAPPTEMEPIKPETELKPPGGEAPEREISRLAERAEQDAIAAKLTEGFEGLPEYDVMSMKDQAERAQKIMDADYDSAKRMAMGEEKPPEGVREATMYEAVKFRAIVEKDVDTLHKLATESTIPSKLTEYGQAIKAADSRLMDDPIKVAQEIAEARAEKAKRTGKDAKEYADKIEELNKRLETAEEQLKLYEEKVSIKETKKAIDKLKKEKVVSRAKGIQRAARTRALDTEFKSLSEKLSKILTPDQLNIGFDPAVVPVLVEMARNRVQRGFVSAESIVSSIHAEVKKYVKATKRDIRDAISGYGKTTTPNPDKIETNLREAKRQMRLISALEDATKGEAPLRSGMQRDVVSDRVRDLQKKVKQAMKESGIDSKPTKSPEARFKSALDAVKTRLNNQITDLTQQLKTGKKTPKKIGVEYDAEAKALAKQRDELKAQLEAIEGKPGMSDEQRVKVATASAERSIKELERRISEKDLTPAPKGKPPIETPELNKLRAQREELKKEYKALKDAAKPPKDPEASRLQAFKTRTKNKISELEGLLETVNLDPKPKREPVRLDAEGKKIKEKYVGAQEKYKAAVEASGTVTKEEVGKLVELHNNMTEAKARMETGGNRLEYGAAKVAFENYAAALKGSEATIKDMLRARGEEFKTTWKENKAKATLDITKDTIGAITDNSIAMVASLDNSFLGRQGLKTLMTHPSAWWPGAKASFADFAKTIGGQAAKDAMLADIYSRPNFVNGEYQRAKIISGKEEQFPTTLPERVPGIGRVFKASEAAFSGSAMRMRTDLYDLLSTKAKENGVDMTIKSNAESLGKLINSLTARGQWGVRGEGAAIKLVMWAPKMLKANIDVLTAHNFGAGLESKFARKEAAVNLLKIVTETAAIMTIANAIVPGSAETDPRSTDFGKIKIGDTRFDISGGASSVVVLASRLSTLSSKSSQTGLVTKYGTGFGERTAFDALIDFMVNKTTPAAGVVVTWLKGKDRDGEKFTWGSAAQRAYIPIAIQNFMKMKDDITADKLVGAIVDLVGIGANTYDDNTKQKRDIISRIRNGKELTEDQQTVYDSMSEREKRYVESQSELTPQEAAFSNLEINSAIYAWSKMSDSERDELRDMYEMRLDKYIMTHEMTDEEMQKFNESVEKAEAR